MFLETLVMWKINSKNSFKVFKSLKNVIVIYTTWLLECTKALTFIHWFITWDLLEFQCCFQDPGNILYQVHTTWHKMWVEWMPGTTHKVHSQYIINAIAKKLSTWGEKYNFVISLNAYSYYYMTAESSPRFGEKKLATSHIWIKI